MGASLLSIIGVGALLRFRLLDAQSLWYDEGFSIYLARLPIREMTQGTAQDIHPPLYYLLLHFWICMLGDSPFVARVFSVFGGVLNIPLAYALSRHLWNRRAGLLAAFCMAISPLAVYYSQETRMYAWLTTISLLSSYMVLRISERMNSRAGRANWQFAYWLIILAGAYMHYFFLLLLVFHGLYLLGSWWAAGRRPRLLAEIAAVYGAWGAGYALWAPVLVDRYLHDTGYLYGAMAPWETMRRVFMAFCVGPVLDGADAVRIATGYGVIILLASVPLLAARRLGMERRFNSPLRFLWMYLGIPLALIAVLYWSRARVNPHHSVFISPAFWGLLAIGVTSLWDLGEARGSAWSHWAWRGLAVAVALFIAVTGGYANWRYYLEPRYHRPDMRAAIQFLEREIGPDESVVLVSGHMFPIIDYYAPGLRRWPIPDDPVLRLDHQVGFEVSEVLKAAAQGKVGVWQVLWQDYFVDPHDIVGGLLAAQSENPYPTISFHRVKLRHFRLLPDADFSWGQDLSLPAGAVWDVAGVAQGVESDSSDRGPRTGIVLDEAWANRATFRRGESLQITLVWRAEETVALSYHVFTHLVDGNGVVWSQHDSIPAGGKRPTGSWRPGELLVDRHNIEIREVMPPGTYSLVVGLYNQSLPGMPKAAVVGDSGEAMERSQTLAEITVD